MTDEDDLFNRLHRDIAQAAGISRDRLEQFRREWREKILAAPDEAARKQLFDRCKEELQKIFAKNGVLAVFLDDDQAKAAGWGPEETSRYIRRRGDRSGGSA